MLKKILLIGGSSKLGTSLIKKLNPKDYEIHCTFNKTKKIRDNSRISAYKLDLTKSKEQKKFLTRVECNFDTIIFLSAVLKGKSLSNFNSKEIQDNISVNLISQIILLNLILKKQTKGCLIIFLSSISGRKGSFDPIYASAKSALIGFIKSMSKWSAPKFKFIGLCPGIIKDTKMYKSFKKNRLKTILKDNPNKEFLNSDDLADIIIDISKPHWRHANGSIIDVNGGTF